MQDNNNGPTGKQILYRWFMRVALACVDAVTVNMAYYLVLLVRFFYDGGFSENGKIYIQMFLKFAPVYTICCIVVFALFRLYSGIWRYAGVSDANRILGANAVTCAIQVVGSLLLVGRMPFSYYVLGACVQFIVTGCVRFSYQIIAKEKSHLSVRSDDEDKTDVIIVGLGESAHGLIKMLYDNKENVVRPVCVVDPHNTEGGRFFDGLLVLGGIDSLSDAISKYSARGVMIADTSLTPDTRSRIREICKDSDVVVQDYTGFTQNYSYGVGLQQLLEISSGKVRIIINGKSSDYDDPREAIMAFPEKYLVKSVSVLPDALVIEVEKNSSIMANSDEAWAKDYEQQTGETISFF